MAVTIKNSPQGAVVIVRGFGWVTASSLMTFPAATALAARIEFNRAKRKAVRWT